MITKIYYFIILLLLGVPLTTQLSDDCSWRHNITDIDHISGRTAEILENCLYYYLIKKNMDKNGNEYESILNKPPNDDIVTITIDHFMIHSVEVSKKSLTQFYIYGELFLRWNDSRFTWDNSEWKIEQFALHDTHHIWTPTFIDETFCTFGYDCMSKIMDVEIQDIGVITARLSFKLPSFCSINYSEYPEESNDCCIFLSIIETDKAFSFDVQTKKKVSIVKNVVVTENSDFMINNHEIKEASAWFVEDRKIDVIKVGGIRGQFLRICIHAYKKMPTLKIALRIPISIATILMLMAPLFGDLKTQAYVKLITLCLQTICFLYLCSLAPETGFGGKKPKIYSFYEFLVGLSFINILFTLLALAMSRVKKTVPPTHNLYLLAKLINRYMCCTEPEPSMNYTRQIDDGMERNQNSIMSNDPNDYRMQWAHIWVAFNHLIAAISICIFLLVLFCDIIFITSG